MSLVCEVLPVSAFQSTNLNNRLETFNDLGDRVKRTLGYPLITLEIHQDQLFNNIQIAIQFFSKFAGFTKEYLVFDSNLYEKNKGIRLDHLFTLAKAGLTDKQKIANSPVWTGADFTVEIPQTVYICTSAVGSSIFSASSSLSSVFDNGLEEFEIVDKILYDSIITYNTTLSGVFKESVKKGVSLQSQDTTATEFSNVFDYDIMDYRKVISITDFEEGSNQGVNTLFTLEQTLAQQTYFSYAMGNYGFDLISWYVLKDWLKMREKLLATKPSYDFDDRTQILRLYPQPKSSRDSSTQYYGVIQCYVERPLKDIIKEQWVYQYSLALTKIVLGRIRGKFSGTTLFGGGTINADMLNEGLKEKEELETKLYEGAPGFGDAEPPMFFVG